MTTSRKPPFTAPAKFLPEAFELNSELGNVWTEDEIRADGYIAVGLAVASMRLDGASLAEIGARIGGSASIVRQRLQKLERMFFKKDPNAARNSLIRIDREHRLMDEPFWPEEPKREEHLRMRPRGGEDWTCTVPDGCFKRMEATIVDFDQPHDYVKVLIESGRLIGSVRRVALCECEDLQPPLEMQVA